MVDNMPRLKNVCIVYIDIIGTKFLKFYNINAQKLKNLKCPLRFTLCFCAINSNEIKKMFLA